MKSLDGAHTVNSFRVDGIVGGKSYQINLSNECNIIVGPNGTGKSTFLSLFYLFISRQWSRLIDFEFSKLTLSHSRGEIELNKADILSLDISPRVNPQIRSYISKLSEANQLDIFYKTNLSSAERNLISSTINVPSDDISQIRRFITRELGINRKSLDIDGAIRRLNLAKVLYMPTYRRIEKDLRSIFPDIEERVRFKLNEGYMSATKNMHFQEIVSFGMDDIVQIIGEYSLYVKEFQRNESESASQEYIRDIVHGEIQSYSLKGVRDLSGDFVAEFIRRLDDNLFTQDDKDLLTEKINSLRERKKGKPNKDMQYLGFYVEKMLSAHKKVKAKEDPLLKFVSYVNKYISHNKEAVLENLDFKIRDKVTKKEVGLDKLSSGEKQIISIFAYLLLRKGSGFLVFIDEPELSLSVPWQKQFLPDIMSTGGCEYLISVTHSPFVFDNDLRNDVIDVRRLEG